MKSYKTITIGGKQKRLHRCIMEAYLGRELKPWELVHHKDGDKHNNDLSNLAITIRAIHIKTHGIGKKTRFKAKYTVTKDQLIDLYVNQKMPMWKVAEITNTTCGAVWRAIKKHGVKRNVRCFACGEKAKYIKAELCNKCYQKDYYYAHK